MNVDVDASKKRKAEDQVPEDAASASKKPKQDNGPALFFSSVIRIFLCFISLTPPWWSRSGRTVSLIPDAIALLQFPTRPKPFATKLRSTSRTATTQEINT
jgi:hypothetical protein